MALLPWLKKEGFGTYDNVDGYVAELARRSTSALGALSNALAAVPQDLKELAQGPSGQQVCAELVRDLRAMKGARLAALRGILAAGAGSHIGKLFPAAFDLLADPRLPDADRAYLVSAGMKAFLEATPPAAVQIEVLRAAAAAAEAVKALGADKVKEILDGFPREHTPALTLRHAALGEPLPADLETKWLEVLARQHKAAKNAPPAAKRLGTAPEWPPIVPEVLSPLLKRAEEMQAPAKAAPAAAAKTAATPGAPTIVPPPSGAKTMPEIRPRARIAPQEESFKADSVTIASDVLRSDAPAPAPVKSEPQTAVAVTPAQQLSLKKLRFGEQVELIANRGLRAIERLIAAFDARCAIAGTEKALAELTRAAQVRGPKDVNEPMLDELLQLASNAKTPSTWRRAAKALLQHMSPDRFATLPTVEHDPRTMRVPQPAQRVER